MLIDSSWWLTAIGHRLHLLDCNLTIHLMLGYWWSLTSVILEISFIMNTAKSHNCWVFLIKSLSILMMLTHLFMEPLVNSPVLRFGSMPIEALLRATSFHPLSLSDSSLAKTLAFNDHRSFWGSLCLSFRFQVASPLSSPLDWWPHHHLRLCWSERKVIAGFPCIWRRIKECWGFLGSYERRDPKWLRGLSWMSYLESFEEHELALMNGRVRSFAFSDWPRLILRYLEHSD